MPLTKAEITRLRSLQEKKHRDALGLFVVEGPKVVGELLAAKFPFVELYATPDWSPVGGVPSPREVSAPDESSRRAREGRNPTRLFTLEGTRPCVPEDVGRPAETRALHPRPLKLDPQLIAVTPAEMARISHYPTPSAVLAVGGITRSPLAAGALDRGLTLALDGIQDPGNVGTLLRIADWFAFDRVVLSPECADLFSQKVINASMGSFARVVAHTAPLEVALAGTTAPVLGCELQGEDVHTLPALRDAVVVIGSEGRGLSPGISARVTKRVTIPRFGGAESLNAAVAAAIVCDNLRRLAP